MIQFRKESLSFVTFFTFICWNKAIKVRQLLFLLTGTLLHLYLNSTGLARALKMPPGKLCSGRHPLHRLPETQGQKTGFSLNYMHWLGTDQL